MIFWGFLKFHITKNVLKLLNTLFSTVNGGIKNQAHILSHKKQTSGYVDGKIFERRGGKKTKPEN